MTIYNYWLSPNRIARFNFLEDTIIDKAANLNDEEQIDYDITIKQAAAKEIPAGLIIDKWILKKNDINQFDITTSFKTLNNQNKQINEVVRTSITNKRIEMVMPFHNLHLLGNDLCFFSLLEDNALTIRCSSIFMNHTLYLFCGRGGSGKSTMLKKASDSFNELTAVADDHLTIKIGDHSVEAITPFWDDINLNHGGKKVSAEKMVLFFMEDSSSEVEHVQESFSKMALLVKHCVLFAISGLATTRIMMIVEELVEKYEMFTCPVGSSHEVLRLLENGDI